MLGSTPATAHEAIRPTGFNPRSRAVATSGPLAGQGYALPFPGNKIDPTLFNPVTKNFLGLLQTLGVKAQNSNLTGNYLGIVPSSRYSVIPSFKIDHTLTSKDKLSFFYQETNLQDQVSVGEQPHRANLDILLHFGRRVALRRMEALIRSRIG